LQVDAKAKVSAAKQARLAMKLVEKYLYDLCKQWTSYLINAIKAKEIFLKNCQLCGWPEGSHHRSNQQADDYLEGTHSCLAS
jgi:hypothetical protein